MKWKIFFLVLDFFFPKTCAVCGIMLDGTVSGPLCLRCRREIEYARVKGRRCFQCGTGLTSEEVLCFRCRNLEKPGPPGRGLFYYRGSVRVFLQRYKFAGVKSLSGIIADEILKELTAEERDAVIVPVPSGRKSRRRNGWGHMEQVAACLAKEGLTVCPKLLRRSSGKDQKSLDRRAREENSRAVFHHSGKKIEKGCLLIDDVRTTGASIRAASAALEEGGSRVIGWITFAID